MLFETACKSEELQDLWPGVQYAFFSSELGAIFLDLQHGVSGLEHLFYDFATKLLKRNTSILVIMILSS